MKTKKTKAAYAKRARRGMLGFTISWIDENPFSENANISNGSIDHANPIQKLICRDMWLTSADWICGTEFTWRVAMRAVFTGAPRGDCYADAEHVFTCTLLGNKSKILNDAMEESLKEFIAGNDAYPAGHKNKGKYSHCEFLAEVIGI